MNNLKKSAEIQRAVANAAYSELQTFPKRRFGRMGWYTDDSFELTHEDIYFTSLEALEAKFCEDELSAGMLDANIEAFLESEKYEVMQHEARAAHADAEAYRRDPYKYNGVSRSDFMSIRSNGL